MFDRIITPQIESVFWTGKVILILGPRQVGKTTLIESLLTQHAQKDDIVRFHGEYSEDHDLLNSLEFGRMISAIGDRKWIMIDE